MASLTQFATQFIADHRAWAGVLLGATAFGESMMVIGAFLPTPMLLFLAGGLIATGVLDAAPVMAWTVAGAIVGDAASYLIGRRLGLPVLRHRMLRKHKRTIARTRLAMRRLGPMAIYVGRFAGPLRATIPVMAGILSMPARRFHLANVLSGVAWVAAFIGPGYVAGRGLGQLSSIDPMLLVELGLGVAAAAGLALGLAWTVRRLARRASSPWPPAKVAA